MNIFEKVYKRYFIIPCRFFGVHKRCKLQELCNGLIIVGYTCLMDDVPREAFLGLTISHTNL